MRLLTGVAAWLLGGGLILLARLLTAPRAIWQGIEPVPRQRVYYANHTSNADLILIWSVLPPRLRRATRPVAGSDYWLKSRLRAFVGHEVVRAVMVERRPEHRGDEDPIALILDALDEGSSLIIFPEGKRNMTDAPALPFKSGIYNISRARPAVDLVPVWIENLNRVMPKGHVIPVPLLCTVSFGAPIRVEEGEEIGPFLARAADAMVALRPNGGSKP
ncbi:phospholipid/glycerol acyltransferase [Dinoroseobacter shibae DFL 12 = DSM 16493]|jgi:1-acyl-sn-glycerol-3-phosphate acyltransferase|uniref:Phospholipid/glycerol acyltransferase n=1 Tax=Dinoroseobacter shibae (strain DSM 16493 / NCIMB 14021 / DFL 12) TaxID=398580 RepID=A8LLC5_DINSH|nr:MULTISPECIES: lysophospholipid acyltransferase family protein [Dinoroseobacter]ABV91935.1 phospholipid/glycerol acyltransferase [Dinoroseobacter shibae DFL 12 = DSM 16493]MDD9717318.1 lysophospholipid acyltransferase family protein [Dinoroseobacter sp. PD6]URF46909.1 1-acyl-sn-glycerol-3-phosphate acyltransferase [Dinoroseobacter shibae]URF51220.1 1-acyl-sn-glycerol-3-phosphate acyltransferase [Dinoroseobacter shibae]